MKISKQDQQYHLMVSPNELVLLERCVLEAIEIGEAEFESRVGESRSRAVQFLKHFADVKQDQS
jgi:hypothetical protein